MLELQNQTDTLYLTEIFSSLQGESSLSGLPTLFIRTAGCNLRCTWCDTPYSFPRGIARSLTEILHKAEQSGLRHVCVTGGEPLLQKGVFSLFSELLDKGFFVSVETGGSLSIASIDPRVKIVFDIKCPGSGMHLKQHWESIAHLKDKDEIKFVVLDRQDYEYAKKIITKYRLADIGCELLLSPVHDALKPSVLAAWMLKDRLVARLNLQIHKYIWGAHVKGV